MSTASSPTPVITIGRHGGGYPLALLAAYQKLGRIDLRAVVANGPGHRVQAALAQWACDELGMRVPVGYGVDNVGGEIDAALLAAPYAAAARRDGQALLVETLASAEPGSVHLLLTSALTDAALLLKREPELCRTRIAAVTMIRGASYKGGVWLPVGTTTDSRAAQAVFETLQTPAWQHVEVRMVMGLAAHGASMVSPGFLTELADGGHPVAVWLRGRVEVGINRLRPANSPGGDPERVEDWLEGIGPQDRGGPDPSFDRLPVVSVYDVLAGVAAIEPDYFLYASFDRQPHVKGIGYFRGTSDIRNPDGLTARILELLRLAFTRS